MLADEMYDITIVGGGPSGLFAAFYAGLRGASVKIIDSLPQLGGQLMALYPDKYIYDIPGFPKVLAREFVDRQVEQAMSFSPAVCLDEKVVNLCHREKNGHLHIELETEPGHVHRSRTVIIAAGVGAFVPRTLDIPDVERMAGKGVYYFVKNLETFRGKQVLVVGGGDTALDWALSLLPIARQVVLIHRNDRFRAHEESVRELFGSPSQVLLFHELKALYGSQHVEGATVFHVKTGSELTLDVDAVVLGLGFLANLGPIRDWGLEIVKNSIMVDATMCTNLPAVYAVGDITTYEGKLKLIATATAEAAVAANYAKNYVDPMSRVFPGHSSDKAEELEKRETGSTRGLPNMDEHAGALKRPAVESNPARTPAADPYAWKRHPAAEAYVCQHLNTFATALPAAAHLDGQILARTGSRLFDWLDHLVLAGGDRPRGELRDLGFEQEEVPAQAGDQVFRHPGTVLPPILLRPSPAEAGTALAAAIQVEDIALFLMTHQRSAPGGVPSASIEGTPLSPYRRALAWQQPGRELWVVERRGHPGFVPTNMPRDYAGQILGAMERWAARPRHFEDERAGMEQTLSLARSLCAQVGTETASWIVLAVERVHWQRRNRAAQVQKARQDSLGLGWTNHDHHTFRSSRRNFLLLIQILETLGFRPRERFYAGAEAGWGAQVLDHPAWRPAPAGIFADVDLSPHEVDGDFAHRPLPERYAAEGEHGEGQKLGTVGLWCALHGESMLGAGLHHLAARLDFDKATEDLAKWDVEMMRPFSDFPFLRQAFSRGERWDIEPERLAHLAALVPSQIDEAQYARFVEKGAVGSHLENIQRGEGFKGFNQQTVSDIIRRTDPRAESGMPAA